MRLRTPSPPPDLARPAADETPPAVDLSRARRRASWRTRLVRAGIAAAVLGVLGLATWVIGYSDLLTAERVEVRGVRGALADTVRETAAVPLGAPLARVDTDAVAERVGDVPDVESVTASRSWPSTVVLTVVPRDPVATLSTSEGWAMVDDQGVLFAPQAERPADLPVLLAPSTDQGLAARQAGVSVATALPPRVTRRLEQIEATSERDVRLVLRDGRLVTWGSADDGERKAAVLTVLLRTPATQYDVSVPDRPTLRPVVQ